MELFRLLGTIAIDGTEQAKNELGDLIDSGSEAESTLLSTFRKIGGAVTTYFATGKILNFAQDIVSTSATVSAEISAFNQIMSVNSIGDYVDVAQEKMNALANSVGMASTRLTPYMTSMTAKFKGLGFDIDTATDFAVKGLRLATDASAFWDMSLDESVSHLNSFINGSYEGGEAIGLFANDTQMAQYAIKTGLIESKKEWANLEESIKQATRVEYAQAMFEASGAVGQANKESEQYANTQADLSEKWRQFKALIGEPLLQNIVTPAMNKLGEVVDGLTQGYKDLTSWISNNQDTINQWKGIIENVALAVGVLTSAFLAFKAVAVITGIIQAFQSAQVALALYTATSSGATIAQGLFNGTLTLSEVLVGLLTGKVTLAQLATQAWTVAQGALNAVLNANPIGIIIGLLVALAGVFVVAYNKSETFRTFVNNLWTTIQESFTKIMEVVSSVWESVKTWTIETWNTIVTTLTGFWDSLVQTCSGAWETLKAIVQVGFMFISELVNFFIDVLLIPWNFIWQNFGSQLTDAWNNMRNTVNSFLSKIRDTITNIMTSIRTWWSNTWSTIRNTVSNIWTSIQTTISNILTPIFNTISRVFNNVRNTISNVLSSVRSTISSVWSNIRNTISSVVSSISGTVSSVFNSVRSSISNTFNSIWSTATSIWNSIKSAITTPINNALSTVSDVISRIKGLFNFSWSLPKLKLPHVSISGSFSLVPPRVPSFSIEWYKKAMDGGMILDEPTIFGMKDGKFLGGGEVGSETVVGTQSLMSMIRDASNTNDGALLGILKQIYELLKDDNRLYDIFLRALSDGSFSVVLDGREVGRVVRKYA